MDPSLRSTLLVQAIGVLSYLVGMLLMLFAGIGLFLDLRAGDTGSIPVALVVYAVVGLLLVVFGRVIVWRFAGGDLGGSIWGTLPSQTGPQQSRLEQLGYRTGEATDQGSTPEYEDGTLRVVCTECGTSNDTNYRFCRNCSAQLPD